MRLSRETTLNRSMCRRPMGRFCALSAVVCFFILGPASAWSADPLIFSPSGRKVAFLSSGRLLVYRFSPRTRKTLAVELDIALPGAAAPATETSATWFKSGRTLALVTKERFRNKLWLRLNGSWQKAYGASNIIDALKARPQKDGLVYQSWRDGRPDLHYLQLSGDKEHWTLRLTDDDAFEHSVSFSDDGMRMLFVSHTFDGNDMLIVLDWERLESRRILKNLESVEFASLSPDGRSCIFLDSQGLWKLDLERNLERGRKVLTANPRDSNGRSLPAMPGTAETLRVDSVTWWRGRPVITVRGAGVFVLRKDSWLELPGSEPLSEFAVSGLRLVVTPDGDLTAVGVDAHTPSGNEADRALFAACWSDGKQTPRVLTIPDPNREPGVIQNAIMARRASCPPAKLRELLKAGKRRALVSALAQSACAQDRRALFHLLELIGEKDDAKPWELRLESAVAFLLAGRNRSFAPLTKAAPRMQKLLDSLTDETLPPDSSAYRALVQLPVVGPPVPLSENDSAWYMLRFGFGALAVDALPLDEFDAALKGIRAGLPDDKQTRYAVVRAAVSALDTAGRHSKGTDTLIKALAEDVYEPGDLAKIGLTDWFAAVDAGTVNRARLGHLPPWIEKRLKDVSSALMDKGKPAKGARRMLKMLGAWRPARIAVLLKEAEQDGHIAASLLGNLLLGAYFHNRGEIRKAVPHYKNTCSLAGERFTCDVIEMLGNEGKLGVHRAWRWMDCEFTAKEGPWFPAQAVITRMETLRRTPLRYAQFARDHRARLSFADRASEGRSAYRRLIGYYPGSSAADAARLRLAESADALDGNAWLFQILSESTESKLYKMALARLVLLSKRTGNCDYARLRLQDLSERYSHGDRRVELLDTVKVLEKLSEPKSP